MSNKTFLGKVGTTPKGEWSANTTYERLDWVTYQGSSYIALAQNTNSTPSDSNPNWMVAAKHGEFTEEQLEEFKEAVVAESKQEMDDYTADKKDELDTYETAKETELNTYTTTKKGEIDTHTTQKINAFDNNATSKTTDFNSNATSKTNAYNQNAEDKTTTFNTNASNKQTAFDNNATQKTTAFNENATSKTTAFNTNASDKTTAFNDNAAAKTNAFNQNAQQKTAEFDSHVTELEEDNENLRNALPEVTGEGSNIVLEGTSKNKYKQPPLPGGNSWQTQLTGKNLLNNTELIEQKTRNGVTATPNADGSITLNGTATANTFLNLSYQDWGDTDFSSVSNLNDNYKAVLINETTGIILNYTHGNLITCIRISNGTVINNLTVYPMILLKTETDDTYEPYCGGIPSPNPTYKQDIHNVSGDVEVVVRNKNKLDLSKCTVKNGILNSDNSITSNIIDSYYIEVKTTSLNDYLLTHKGQSITFSIDKVLANKLISIVINGQRENSSYQDVSVSNSKTVTFTVANDFTSINSLELRINRSNTKFTDTTTIISQIMLELGNTATSYVPHEQQTLPFTLEQGQKMYLKDYLADDGIHHIRGEITFDGSVDEDWSRVDSWNDFYRISIPISNAKLYTTNNRNGQLCSHFTYNPNTVTGVNLEKGVFCQYHDSNNFYFIIEQSTKDAWVEWLAEHPIKLEYELAEEVIDPYTPTQQEQYNAIKKAISYKDTTIITLSSDDADPLTNVVAVADMSNINNKLELMQAQIDLLS